MPHACPLPSTPCPLPHVTCLVWSCRVLPTFLSLAPGVFLCPVVLSVAIISCTLVFCHVPNACPLPSALHSLPSVWSCWVVPSLCPGACVCVCSYVLLLCSALCCLLLLLLQYVALCCHLTTCEGLVCVCLFIRTKMAKCAPMCSIAFFDTYSWDKVQCPCTAQHCVCETVLGGSAKFWM